MAKIPSRKFSTVKKKIASTKFPKAKLQLSQGKTASQSAKISSGKLAKAKKTTKQVVNATAALGHPTDEQSRQDAVATLKGRTETIMFQKVEKR